MRKIIIIGAVLSLFLAGCSSVKQYKAKTGEAVVAGQAAPKAEYNCTKVGEEKAAYWRAGSVFGSDVLELTAAAVDTAPTKKSNYVHVDMPAKINGFSTGSPTVSFYNCKNLPDLSAK